jgi:hypothetical protein
VLVGDGILEKLPQLAGRVKRLRVALGALAQGVAAETVHIGARPETAVQRLVPLLLPLRIRGQAGRQLRVIVGAAQAAVGALKQRLAAQRAAQRPVRFALQSLGRLLDDDALLTGAAGR